MNRTTFITAASAFFALPLFARAAIAPYEVTHSDAEWMHLLGADRYEILRLGGTEPPYTSPLNSETRKGVYICAGCNLPAFLSQTKYDPGEGWPSFWDVIPNAVRFKDDYELIEKRTEVHCRRCGSHLGHRFDDGPAPTHLRYCIDGLA